MPDTQESVSLAPLCHMGDHELKMGGRHLDWLRESNDVLDDDAALRKRIAEDGYLLIRGLQKRSTIEDARRVVLKHLQAEGELDPSRPFMDGIIGPGGRGRYLGGQKELTHHPAMLAQAESPEIMVFCDRLFGTRARTLDYKWLRAVGRGSGTKAHYDIIFMGRGTKELYTCWTPLGDVPLEGGPLAVLVGSHSLKAYDPIKATYGKADVDRDNIEGAFSHDTMELAEQYGGQWRTTEFKMGDILIFGMFVMHAALNNTSDRFRISTDMRYQAANQPVDERFIGDEPAANYDWRKTPVVPLETSRKKWGV